MKKYGILLGILVGVTVMVGCTGNTELGWVNQSGEDIRDIAWYNSSKTDIDASWGSEVVADTKESSLKEVNELNGAVECAVYDNGATDFVEATSIDVGNIGNGDSIQLSEGSANVFDIYASK